MDYHTGVSSNIKQVAVHLQYIHHMYTNDNFQILLHTKKTSSNLCWWVQKTFLKIFVSPTIVKILNLKALVSF